MDSEAPSSLKAALDPQERLQWWGRPKQGLMLRKADGFLVPFSIVWGGFALFWEYRVVTLKNAPFFFMIWGIPFVLAGLYLLVGRFFYDAWRRSQASYGLTAERAIIASAKSYKSIDLARCAEIRIDKSVDGRGTIAFGADLAMYRGYYPGFWPGQLLNSTFEYIEDADRVIALIRRLQKDARARGD